MKSILYIVIGLVLGAFAQERYDLVQSVEKLPKQARELANQVEQPTNQQNVSVDPCETKDVKSLLTDLESVNTIAKDSSDARGGLCEDDWKTIHAFFPDGQRNISRIEELREEAKNVEGLNVSINRSDHPHEAPWVTVTLKE